ncbi:hypothetical protein [Algoriphagus halophilus]|uniref:Transcription elongation factor, GreA/GreB, C-term n=1 Tax=Algoriphagus halophilus TaxID=226505 RepID=A0A1N6FIR6_9BACT|nr:hypothetical protein [Algoriphagus halophilus]SIN95169.1 hypothetical protein SAMN05444394_2481 [Algoriphagus halophilus]
MNGFKHQVFQAAIDLLEERKSLLANELSSLQLSIKEETKSSAGDKYETGREMMRQEIGKVENQFKQNQQLLQEFQHLLNTSKDSEKITEGSLLQWGEDLLFISASLGELVVDGKKVFLLSKNSPLGQVLMGKTKGQEVSFRGKSKRINEVY